MSTPNPKSQIYQGAIGALEREMRILLESGNEAGALELAGSPNYRALGISQRDPRNPSYFRTAEDPRVLAFKLRHKVPADERGLIGSSQTTLGGAFDYIRNDEPPDRRQEIFDELASACLEFFDARKVHRTMATAVLQGICGQVGSEDMLRAFLKSRGYASQFSLD